MPAARAPRMKFSCLVSGNSTTAEGYRDLVSHSSPGNSEARPQCCGQKKGPGEKTGTPAREWGPNAGREQIRSRGEKLGPRNEVSVGAERATWCLVGLGNH